MNKLVRRTLPFLILSSLLVMLSGFCAGADSGADKSNQFALADFTINLSEPQDVDVCSDMPYQPYKQKGESPAFSQSSGSEHTGLSACCLDGSHKGLAGLLRTDHNPLYADCHLFSYNIATRPEQTVSSVAGSMLSPPSLALIKGVILRI